MRGNRIPDLKAKCIDKTLLVGFNHVLAGRFVLNSRVIIFCLMALLMITPILGQVFDDPELEWDDRQQLTGERKSAFRAIMFSSIFPGGGHLYGNRRSIGTYLFPVIEIALWVGYFHFDSKGSSIEDDYEAFADKHYVWDYYIKGRDALINGHDAIDSDRKAATIYRNRDPDTGELIHFRLDPYTDPQHYYEDIGKYNKYIFGWTDWNETYFDGDDTLWRFNDDGIWLGNWPVGADPEEEDYHRPYTPMRAEYIQMRRDAQENFDRSYLMTFGLAINRIVSSLDAVRVTQRYNRELRYSSNFNIHITPKYTGNTLIPTLNLTYRY